MNKEDRITKVIEKHIEDYDETGWITPRELAKLICVEINKMRYRG